jgi:hypothetical protein
MRKSDHRLPGVAALEERVGCGLQPTLQFGVDPVAGDCEEPDLSAGLVDRCRRRFEGRPLVARSAQWSDVDERKVWAGLTSW